MKSAELKAALETIIADMPIPTRFRCGNEQSVKDLFCEVDQLRDGALVVSVKLNATTGTKEGIEILNAVRTAVAKPGSNRFFIAKKSTASGFWHMQRFCETARHLKFYPEDCTDPKAVAARARRA